MNSKGMSSASLVLGILSILLIFCGGSFISGALGIMFALLSRGAGRMDTKARAGLGLSIAGMIISLVLFTALLIFVIHSGKLLESDYDDHYDYDYHYDYEYEMPDEGTYTI